MRANRNKSWSRFIAIQVLFQVEFNEKMKIEFVDGKDEKKIKSIIKNMHDINKNLSEFKDIKYNAEFEWLINLLQNVISNKKDIDEKLSKKFVKEWSLKRMDSILLNILRSGFIEFSCNEKVPAKVIINEYTNIASSFFSNSEVNFVNGILDVLAKEFRPTEFKKQ